MPHASAVSGKKPSSGNGVRIIELHSRRQNHLLAALPATEYERLSPAVPGMPIDITQSGNAFPSLGVRRAFKTTQH